ncbi:fumarylacetoacetate hydrolase family protein [Paraburkholderia tropica]|uniref:fumarylacetoacetate hydrolase family protein n=1 Tax=Paraburkholderia tropica TaxID=92647 RepID=UPI002AB68880|nr:fumarylacetoacetate hydrolase family protein [Paraburkholderia tropica]
MKFATLRDGTRDGCLLLVSRDLSRAVKSDDIAPTLQRALEDWRSVEPALLERYATLNAGTVAGAFVFEPAACMAPLPRTHQFVDASAFLNHGQIMSRAYELDPPPTDRSVMIQRQGDDFRGAREDYSFPDLGDQCDFEGEVAVVLDDVAQGVSREDALSHIRLVMLFNDVSMRGKLVRELKLGFGFIQAKPAPAFAAVAVTPDELGDAWADGRVSLPLHVFRNDELVGRPNGREMSFSFGCLIEQLAYNRNLTAGTVLGSGTFSNEDHAAAGSACLAEIRALERLRYGESRTPWLAYGERLRFEMFGLDGQSVFGTLEQRFVRPQQAAIRNTTA